MIRSTAFAFVILACGLYGCSSSSPSPSAPSDGGGGDGDATVGSDAGNNDAGCTTPIDCPLPCDAGSATPTCVNGKYVCPPVPLLCIVQILGDAGADDAGDAGDAGDASP